MSDGNHVERSWWVATATTTSYRNTTCYELVIIPKNDLESIFLNCNDCGKLVLPLWIEQIWLERAEFDFHIQIGIVRAFGRNENKNQSHVST